MSKWTILNLETRAERAEWLKAAPAGTKIKWANGVVWKRTKNYKWKSTNMNYSPSRYSDYHVATLQFAVRFSKNPKRLNTRSARARWGEDAPEGTRVVWMHNGAYWTKQDGKWRPGTMERTYPTAFVARHPFTRISPKRIKRLDAAPVGVVVAWKDSTKFRKATEGWLMLTDAGADASVFHYESWYVAQRSFHYVA